MQPRKMLIASTILLTMPMLGCGATQAEVDRRVQATMTARTLQEASRQQPAPPAPQSQPQVLRAPVEPPANNAQACPDIGTVSQLTRASGIHSIGEACGFAVTNGAAGMVTCPSGWMCTLATSQGVLLVKGSGDQYRAGNGTWRFVDGYDRTDAVHDPCALLRGERGARPVGFTC